MKKFQMENIETCPVNRLASESLRMLKEVCRQRALDGAKKPLMTHEQTAEQEANLLEDSLQELDSRITNGYRLILARLGKAAH